MGREKPNFKGEAVAVQVAPGKYLFAVLDGYGFKTAWNAYLPATNKPRSRAEVGEYYSALQGAGETRVLQPDQYPLLVTFQDAGDPASLKRVVPGAINAVFGPGYYLKSIEFSITDEADD
ncbi:hypothetical protein C7449_1013 [Mycoplana dimorpha]|uniref:Uncharacterized protein n=4 Tax=Mycoplana dimorpha TaxID=28320 RepID=A0A2T5BH92_MYCDI|nr:hypothetical protein C7449_1013 [Mycoplana dimorpha]